MGARLLAAAAVLMVSLAVLADSATAQPAGLVAAYSFDEGAGTLVGDASGNTHTGTITGATWATVGRFGGSLSFNGTNNWVTVADAASLDLGIGMTLEAWVYPTALSGWRTVILKERPGDLAYALYAHDNAPRPAAYMNMGGVDVAARGGAGLPLNAWTHLTTTYDGVTLRLYVNGSEAGSQPVDRVSLEPMSVAA